MYTAQGNLDSAFNPSEYSSGGQRLYGARGALCLILIPVAMNTPVIDHQVHDYKGSKPNALFTPL